MRPPDLAAAEVSKAAAAALTGIDPAAVRAAILGISGTSSLTDPTVAAHFQQIWDDIGLTCPVQAVPDVLVSFAAGTTSPDGTVIICGTGAVAADIRNGHMISYADGLGWLLGDRGSGFWLGRQAATQVAQELHAGRTKGPLTRLLTPQILGDTAPFDADALVIAVHNDPPQHLARLAPLVIQAAQQGDPLAKKIITDAAGELITTVNQIRQPAAQTPIVLAGSLLRHAALLRDAVTQHLTRHWPNTPILVSQPGETGAARLARRTTQ